MLDASSSIIAVRTCSKIVYQIKSFLIGYFSINFAVLWRFFTLQKVYIYVQILNKYLR